MAGTFVFGFLGGGIVALKIIGYGPLPILSTAVLAALLAYLFVGLVLKQIGRSITAQKHFVMNVAHELRGPIAAMKLEGELALRGAGDAHSLESMTAESQNLVRAIQGDLDGLQQMAHIIKNLSILTSMEYAGEHDMPEKVDLSVLLARLGVVAERLYADDKHIHITTEAAAPIYVFGDASKLEQIVMNLLKNAVAYSPEDSEIVASTSYQAGRGTLSIRDRGIGISQQDLPHIFDPFYRVKQRNGGMRRADGSGLGLAIVAALAKSMGAEVSVESVLHEGSTFTLRFPAVLRHT